MRTGIRILHLSDLHARGDREREAWRRRRVLSESFWRNLDELQEDGEFDVLCFTGDLADWGQADEYEAAGQLLTELLTRLRLPKERLFLVPGNHDIARPVAKEFWRRARKTLSPPDVHTVASRWLAGESAPAGLDDAVRDAVLERQRAYRDFLSSFGLSAQRPENSPHGKLGYRVTLRLPSRPFDLHLIGLDSAWLAGDDEDSGKLLLTEDQVMRLSTDARGAPLDGIRIALIHHPLTDLADGIRCRRLLAENTDLVLRGHLHSVEPELWADPDRRLIQLAAGCLYDGQLGDTYPNACQTICINLDERGRPARYDLRLRAFSPHGGHWHDDGSLYQAAKNGRLCLAPDGRVLDAEPVHFVVPLRENQYFTGREEQLTALAAALNSRGRAAVTQPQALSGLGGVGKTQLALAYAFRERHRYQAVLWVRADSEDNLCSEFAKLAAELGLPKAEEPQSLDDTASQVRLWLERAEPTLLICDGADAPDRLRRYLPRRGRTHVLITSRAHDFQTLGIVQPVEIVELSLPEAVEFLLRRTARVDSGPDERAAAEALAQELGRLPLALEQAAAYVVAKAVSLADYLVSYKKRRLRLLEQSQPLLGDYPETVATTWHLNFEEVRKHPPAAALLRFVSFLAPDAIPIELLLDGAAHFDPKLARATKGAAKDPVIIGELLEPLLRYSLIRRDREENTISIHRMVQEVVKDSIQVDSRSEYARRVLQVLCEIVPDPARVEEWPRCERLFRHAIVGTQLCEEHRIEGEGPAHLHNQLALYLDHRRQPEEAERLFRRAISFRKKVDDSASASLKNRVSLVVNLCNLASLLQEAGRNAEANEKVYQAIRLLEEKHGPDFPFLAIPLLSRAHLLHNAGQFLDAEPVLERAWQLAQTHPEVLLKCGSGIATALAVNALDLGLHDVAEERFARALTLCRELHGPDSPQLAHTQTHQGRLRKDQGEYKDAERVQREALASTEKLFGREHPRYALVAGSLARALIERGSYAECLELLAEVRAIWDSLPGSHPELPKTLQDLATCHKHLAHYAEAAALGKEALRLAEEQSGADAPSLWTYLNTLGLIYLDQELFSDADRAFRRSLDLAIRSSGDHSLPVSSLRNNIALVHEAQGQFLDALKEYELALEIGKKRLGPLHPETCLTLHNMAQVYVRIGRYHDAKPLYESVLASWRKAFGNTHNKVAVCLYGLAFVNTSLGDLATAEQQLLESFALSEAVLPAEHPDLAQSLAALGQHYKMRDKHGDALPYYERAVAILRKKEPDSMVTVTLEGSLGATLSALGRHAEAERLLRECLRKHEAKLGAENALMGPLLSELALCLVRQGRETEAEGHFLRALKIIEKMPGQGGPLQAVALSNLAHLRKEQGRAEEAAELESRVLEIRKQTLGAEHPDVAMSHFMLGELAILRGQPDEARQHLARGLQSDTSAPLQTIQASRIGHAQLELGDFKGATTSLKDALRAAEAEHGQASSERLRKLHDLAAAQIMHGDLSGLAQTLSEADELSAKLARVEPSLRLSFVHAKAFLLRNQGKPREAEQLLVQALRNGQGEHEDPDCLGPRIQLLNGLADVLEVQRRFSEASSLYLEAEQLLARLPIGRERDTLTIVTLFNQASNLRHQEQFERADAIFERAIVLRDRLHGVEHPHNIVSWMQEADFARRRGDLPRAKALLKKALAKAQTEWSAEHPHRPHLLRSMGRICQDLGELTEAREHFKNAAESSRTRRAEDPRTAFDDEALLALRLRNTGDPAGALAATERAFEIAREFPAAVSTSRSAMVRAFQGTLHRDQGNIPEALSAFDCVVRLYEQNPPQTDSDRHQLASAHHAKGDCLFRQSRFEEARAAYETSLCLRRETQDRELGEEAATLNNLSQLRVVADDLDGADALLRETTDLARRAGDPWALLNTGRSHANLLKGLGRTADARKLLEEILPLARQHFGEQSEEAEELSRRLAELSDTSTDAGRK